MSLDPADVLARVKVLPPLPHAVFALRAALADDAVRVERVVAAIANDQALTIAALRLANSSFYGVRGRVATLRDAVQILGLGTLSAAVTTAAVMAAFDPRDCPAFDFDASWRHAIATALSAQALAVARGLDGETAYVSGLLHDIGRLVLAVHYPVAFAESMQRVADDDAFQVDAERATLGIDHAEIGAMVAGHWGLAPAVVDAIRHHHDLPDTAAGSTGAHPGPALQQVDLVHLADNITYALGLSMSEDEMVPPLSIDAWERMGLSSDELDRLFVSVESRMQGVRPGVTA